MAYNSSHSPRDSADFSLRQAHPPEGAAPSTPIITQEPFPAERSQTSPKQKPLNPKLFADLNLALGLQRDGSGTMSLNATNGSFPSFYEGPPTNGPVQRQAPSPMQQGQPGGNNGVNGVGQAMNGMGVGMPANAGQQMDVNMVYQRLMELSEVLRDNRERTQGIVAGAEELATRAAANGASPSLQDANHEVSDRLTGHIYEAARIADLTRQVNQLQHVKQILVREQRENTKLIGEYETALATIVEEIRNFAFGKSLEKAQLSREYNKLLQDEKDAHLATRLEKDDWHAKFMRSVEMIRTAYRLRCEEEEVPVRIIAALQNEVRAYRNALGMEQERFEEETGFEILKDLRRKDFINHYQHHDHRATSSFADHYLHSTYSCRVITTRRRLDTSVATTRSPSHHLIVDHHPHSSYSYHSTTSPTFVVIIMPGQSEDELALRRAIEEYKPAVALAKKTLRSWRYWKTQYKWAGRRLRMIFEHPDDLLENPLALDACMEFFHLRNACNEYFTTCETIYPEIDSIRAERLEKIMEIAARIQATLQAQLDAQGGQPT
ncbi:hypothetical protein MMC11_001292 [Xylographa trunciseda]|nr:hypothetical protein [Xylographa trunciseda]